ncbi:hypothetical protein, partial [Burkholderia ambifaria]|uniref:hypothetical protein n=1 Tax=Burkholderia ambifaria TaxID=152480 RepID=UPI000A6CA1B9
AKTGGRVVPGVGPVDHDNHPLGSDGKPDTGKTVIGNPPKIVDTNTRDATDKKAVEAQIAANGALDAAIKSESDPLKKALLQAARDAGGVADVADVEKLKTQFVTDLAGQKDIVPLFTQVNGAQPLVALLGSDNKGAQTDLLAQRMARRMVGLVKAQGLDPSTLQGATAEQQTQLLTQQEQALPVQQAIQTYINEQTKGASDASGATSEQAASHWIATVMNVSDYASEEVAKADFVKLQSLVKLVQGNPGYRPVTPWPRGTGPVVVDRSGHVVDPSGKPTTGVVVYVPPKDGK